MNKNKPTYSPFAVLLADPVNPMPEAKRTYHMTKIYEGLDALDTMLHPEIYHWQAVADAANMLETLCNELNLMDDPHGVIKDGMEVLALSWKQKENGIPNQLDHDDITKLRLMVNSYMFAMETLPERAMIVAHRQTEKRICKILNGNKKEGDIIL